MDYDKITQQVVSVKLKAVEKLMDDLAGPLKELANPEKLIGKPYDSWTVEDKAALQTIYGPGENPLTNLIIDKEFERVKQLELGVI